MRDRVDDYEEAVKIHYEYTESEIFEHNKNVHKKRIAFSAAVMTGASVALGIISGHPAEMTLAMVPSIGIVTGLSYLDYHQYIKEINSIKDGSYFEGKDKSVIIDNANRYIDLYNEHIAGRKDR